MAAMVTSEGDKESRGGATSGEGLGG